MKVQVGQTHPERVLLWEGRAAVWRCLWWLAVLGNSPWGWGWTAVSLCQLSAMASRALSWIPPASGHHGWGARGCCRLLAFWGGAVRSRTNPPRRMCSLAITAAAWCSRQWISQGEKFVPEGLLGVFPGEKFHPYGGVLRKEQLWVLCPHLQEKSNLLNGSRR